VRALTASLRGAAQAGGRRLLIMTDQEGGLSRRFRWAPPAASADELGRLTEGPLRNRGRATATALERLGVDVDLAPVADVPAVEGSFIARQRRGFSTIPARAAKDVTAFAAGLLDGGVAPTLKHFPGLGLATVSTDDAAVTIEGAPASLAPGLVPYRRAVAAGVVPLVMVANAAYTAYGGRPAAWSPAVLRLLGGIGFTGVTITDALEPLATTHDVPLATAAIRAARAGVDLLLFVGSERSTEAVYDALLAEAQAGRFPRAALQRSEARIDELAATYAG
jgi:beta-N-acetylhexosaminidase